MDCHAALAVKIGFVSMSVVNDFWRDVRYAARTVRNNPVFAAVTIVTLALGIGANTAVFSVVNAVIFRSLPVKDGDRLQVIASARASAPTLGPVSFPDLQDYRAATHDVFEDIAGYSVGFIGLAPEHERSARVLASWVTGNYVRSGFQFFPLQLLFRKPLCGHERIACRHLDIRLHAHNGPIGFRVSVDRVGLTNTNAEVVVDSMWYERRPSALPDPTERQWRPPQINFSSTDVAGNSGGLIFVVGTVIIVAVGLPAVVWFLLGGTAGGCVVAWLLVTWRTRAQTRFIPSTLRHVHRQAP